MKAAKRQRRSLKHSTLTLPQSACILVDELRGNLPRSVFVQQLIKVEKRRFEAEQAFVVSLNAAYTPEVVNRTLKINAEFPIHED